MREIKFRAWDKEEKRWYDFESGDLDYEGNNPTIAFFNLTDNLVVMQFIGLKDKKGKEIFEGDKVYVPWNGFGIVKFSYGKFIIKGKDGKTTDLSTHWDTCEVLGNIYENPELLEDQK